MKEINKVHFSIEGEFLTNFFRELWIENKCIEAYNGIKTSLIGELSHGIVTDILTGQGKLIGENELNFIKDNTKNLHGISLTISERWNRILNDIANKISSLKSWGSNNRQDDILYLIKQLFLFSDKLIKLRKELDFIVLKFGNQYKYTYENIYRRVLEYEDSFKPVTLKNAEKLSKSISNLSSVEEHVQNTIRLDKLNKIEPTDDYSHNAIWISPKGLVYGMTGDIANMLHIRMADLLAPTLPGYKKSKNEIDSYDFLESLGFMKITYNWVLMEVDREDNYPTLAQIKSLSNIIKSRNIMGIMVGYTKRPLTKTLIEAIDTEEKAAKLKKWFSVKDSL